MNESRSLIRNSVRSSDRLWLACTISTLNISTWSKGGRPPRERSARGTALSRSGRKSSKSTKPFSRSSALRRKLLQTLLNIEEPGLTPHPTPPFAIRSRNHNPEERARRYLEVSSLGNQVNTPHNIVL